MDSSGLLFVFGECGPHVKEEDFNDWYDNEHAPARLTVPGFRSAARYKATDDKKPSWLAVYDMDSSSTADTEAYKGLTASASPRERSIIANLETLNRNILTKVVSLAKPDLKADALLGKHIYVVSWTVQPELEDEFLKWYAEEHLPDIGKTSGWLRGRVFKLETNAELAGKATVDTSNTPSNYFTIHNYMTDDYLPTREFKAATNTPWSKKILSSVKRAEGRRFMLYKDFGKPS